MLPMFPAKGMFSIMKARHQLWMDKYPNAREARAFPLTGIENTRPETAAAGRPRVDVSKPPFDPCEFMKSLPEWNDIQFDRKSETRFRWIPQVEASRAVEERPVLAQSGRPVLPARG